MNESYRIIGTGSEWFWIMLQFVAVLVSFIFVILQLRAQKLATMLSALAGLDHRWTSEGMIRARIGTCEEWEMKEKKLNDNQALVAAFFEEIGVYVKRGALDTIMVWELYSYFIEHYWAMLYPNIQELRSLERDTSYYSNFEYLMEVTARINAKKGLPRISKTEEQTRHFIIGERQMLKPSN